MAKGKWSYHKFDSDQFGIRYDDGTPNGRYLWMGLWVPAQISIARIICKEMNRASVEIEPSGPMSFAVTSRNGKPLSAKKKGG